MDLEMDLVVVYKNAEKPQIDKIKDEISKTTNKEDVLNKYLEKVYAIVRETSKRVLGMRHFDVQIYAGIFLHKGYITEM